MQSVDSAPNLFPYSEISTSHFKSHTILIHHTKEESTISEHFIILRFGVKIDQPSYFVLVQQDSMLGTLRLEF